MSDEVDHGDHFDAQVWLLSSVPKLARYVTNDAEHELILRTVYREANRHDMDPDLVMAVMQVESRFDRFAVSSAGAQGLMQVMPFWRNEIGRPQDNLTQIETNVRYGTAILAQYLTRGARRSHRCAGALQRQPRSPELSGTRRVRLSRAVADTNHRRPSEAASRMQGLRPRRLQRGQVGAALTPITARSVDSVCGPTSVAVHLSLRIDHHRSRQHRRQLVAETLARIFGRHRKFDAHPLHRARAAAHRRRRRSSRPPRVHRSRARALLSALSCGIS